jgi:hypothetical protein
MKFGKGLAITTLLMIVMFTGLSGQVSAQAPQFNLLPEELTVTVSREFTVTVEVEINDPSNPLVGFAFTLAFDQSSMEYVSHTINIFPGWTSFIVDLDNIETGIIIISSSADQPPVTETRDWVTITFHCLEEGDTLITLNGNILTQLDIFVDQDSTTVHQVESAPVGGVASPINKLTIIAPYVALVGLIITVSIVYVIKKHKD